MVRPSDIIGTVSGTHPKNDNIPHHSAGHGTQHAGAAGNKTPKKSGKKPAAGKANTKKQAKKPANNSKKNAAASKKGAANKKGKK